MHRIIFIATMVMCTVALCTLSLLFTVHIIMLTISYIYIAIAVAKSEACLAAFSNASCAATLKT